MGLFEPEPPQIAHRAGVEVAGECVLHGPAVCAGGLGDVSKLDRLFGMGLRIGDRPAKSLGATAPGPRTSNPVIVVFGKTVSADAARVART